MSAVYSSPLAAAAAAPSEGLHVNLGAGETGEPEPAVEEERGECTSELDFWTAQLLNLNFALNSQDGSTTDIDFDRGTYVATTHGDEASAYGGMRIASEAVRAILFGWEARFGESRTYRTIA